MTRSEIIDKNKNLFWYTPENQKQNISDSLLIETIFNEGSLSDCRELIATLGGKQKLPFSNIRLASIPQTSLKTYFGCRRCLNLRQ